MTSIPSGRRSIARSSLAAAVCLSLFIADDAAGDVARIEIHLLETVTLTDQQFLTGTPGDGQPVTIAAELRLPTRDATRVPAVVMMQGSGGFLAKDDRWSREFNDLGIATLLVDSFSGRGIVDTERDQSQLSSLTMMIDAFRGLELLARHPRIDPARIAIFGGSRGAVPALYSSVRRFQQMHGPKDAQFVAHIVFYGPCNRTFIADTDVADRPIRIFHGTAANITLIEPCRSYVRRLQEAGNDVVLREYAGAHHGFDNPGSQVRVLLEADSPAGCALVERQAGQIVNRDTGFPQTGSDACVVKRGLTVGFDAAAQRQALDDVTHALRQVFGLPPDAQQNPLIGTWEEIDGRIDLDGTPLPARPNIWIFGGDGYYMSSALPADRPKVNKPLAEMSREELLARFTGGRVNRGVYRVSGDRLITQRLASLDPNEESARIERVFRIDGDVLTLTAADPAIKAQARFRRLQSVSVPER